MLVPAGQVCRPWGGGREGPCDKCRSIGRKDHVCLSCLIAGRESGCPACRGRVRWRDTCPVCDGAGEIDPATRRGVSVFPRAEGLIRYMLDREIDLDGQALVELEGVEADDRDFDADRGALLVVPTRVRGMEPLDPEVVQRVRSARP